MSDPIERQAAIDAIKKSRYLLEAMKKVIKLPPAQPERKRGRWKLQKNGNAICSECGFVQVSAWDADGWDNFCHHCGADMRGEEQDG